MKSLSELRRSLSKSWDKHQLRQIIAKGIELMDGHKQAGLPSGHQYYKTLYGDINMSIQRYCEEYSIPVEAFKAGVPKLRELEALANGITTDIPNFVYPIAAVMLGIVATVYLATCHDLYVFLTHPHWIH